MAETEKPSDQKNYPLLSIRIDEKHDRMVRLLRCQGYDVAKYLKPFIYEQLEKAYQTIMMKKRTEN